jgi:hypothetical protein
MSSVQERRDASEQARGHASSYVINVFHFQTPSLGRPSGNCEIAKHDTAKAPRRVLNHFDKRRLRISASRYTVR